MDYAGFLLFLAAFGGIGLWSARSSRRNEADFLPAGRSVSRLLTASSAAATKYSGYMFIGLILRWTGFDDAVYEGFPGMAAAFALWVAASLPTWLGTGASQRRSGETEVGAVPGDQV